jgi:hypothetical protein
MDPVLTSMLVLGGFGVAFGIAANLYFARESKRWDREDAASKAPPAE